MSVRILLCHSHKPFDQGDFAGVVNILILKFSRKSIKCLEANRLTQFFKKWFAIID